MDRPNPIAATAGVTISRTVGILTIVALPVTRALRWHIERFFSTVRFVVRHMQDLSEGWRASAPVQLSANFSEAAMTAVTPSPSPSRRLSSRQPARDLYLRQLLA